MSYAELLTLLQKMTVYQLVQTATVQVEDEFYPISDMDVVHDSDILDGGHVVLLVKEIRLLTTFSSTTLMIRYLYNNPPRQKWNRLPDHMVATTPCSLVSWTLRHVLIGCLFIRLGKINSWGVLTLLHD